MFKRSLDRLTNVVGIQKQDVLVEESSDCVLSDEVIKLLETLPHNVSLHKSNGDAVWISQKSKDTFKLNSENLLGKSFFDDVNPQDKLTILKAFSDCSISNDEQIVIFRRQLPSQESTLELYQFEVRISHYKSNNYSYFLALIKDVTSEKALIEKAKQEIKEAQASNETKSLFLSNMSHELRTPLNSVIGFSQMLMGEACIALSEDKKIEYASLINYSATHLLGIINDVLDLSKIEVNKFQITTEIFDVAKELESTIALMKPIAKKSNVLLKYHIGEDVPKITADSRAIRQIFINLIANAIKFSNKAESVSVKLTRELRVVRLDISDTGIGMDQETIDQLGSVFYQAKQSASKRFEGTGLGLSIVAGLVELHNGKISFLSKPNKGTTVSVELPILLEQVMPVPANPNDEITYLSKTREPNLLRRLETKSSIRKTG